MKYLPEFCRAVLADPKPDWFDSGCGLCSNYGLFMVHVVKLGEYALYAELRKLYRHFAAEYGDSQYPFNKSGDEYDEESRLNTLYENPKRLEFLRKWSEPK